MEYIRNSHSVYLLTYHIVFVTKYRRPVIDDRISAFLKDQTAKEIHLDPEMDAHVKKYIYGNAPLWQPSYFVATTGTTVMEKVKEYIDSQQTEEHRRKYEKTGRYSKKRHR